MELKEFQKLPFRTILIWESINLFTVEIKKSKNRTIVIDGRGLHDELIGRVDDYTKGLINPDCLRIAPKWIQKLYEVE